MKVGVEKLTWKYIDRKGQLHGPFDTMQMQEWHWRGWLSDDLQLSFGELDSKEGSAGGFRPLRAVFPDPSTAFNSPPQWPMTNASFLSDSTSAEEEGDEVWYTDDEDAEARKWLARNRGDTRCPSKESNNPVMLFPEARTSNLRSSKHGGKKLQNKLLGID